MKVKSLPETSFLCSWHASKHAGQGLILRPGWNQTPPSAKSWQSTNHTTAKNFTHYFRDGPVRLDLPYWDKHRFTETTLKRWVSKGISVKSSINRVSSGGKSHYCNSGQDDIQHWSNCKYQTFFFERVFHLMADGLFSMTMSLWSSQRIIFTKFSHLYFL